MPASRIPIPLSGVRNVIFLFTLNDINVVTEGARNVPLPSRFHVMYWIQKYHGTQRFREHEKYFWPKVLAFFPIFLVIIFYFTIYILCVEITKICVLKLKNLYGNFTNDLGSFFSRSMFSVYCSRSMFTVVGLCLL